MEDAICVREKLGAARREREGGGVEVSRGQGRIEGFGAAGLKHSLLHLNSDQLSMYNLSFTPDRLPPPAYLLSARIPVPPHHEHGTTPLPPHVSQPVDLPSTASSAFADEVVEHLLQPTIPFPLQSLHAFSPVMYRISTFSRPESFFEVSFMESMYSLHALSMGSWDRPASDSLPPTGASGDFSVRPMGGSSFEEEAVLSIQSPLGRTSKVLKRTLSFPNRLWMERERATQEESRSNSSTYCTPACTFSVPPLGLS
mmetsp:Transcript_44220/g.139510  ORF Transcript_44220/g.139510 Transcript_44220/m.139510 type:complete len:256 (+) Transcript_44220:335-1102(+)